MVQKQLTPSSAAWVIIGPGNGLSPVRHQAITWTNVGLLSVGLLGTYFSEIWIGIVFSIELKFCQNDAQFVQGRWVKSPRQLCLNYHKTDAQLLSPFNDTEYEYGDQMATVALADAIV